MRESSMKPHLGKLAWRLSLLGLVLSAILAGGCAPSNKVPVIISLEAEKDCLCAAESCEIRVVAYDPDGDDLSYAWSATGGDIFGEGSMATWTAPDSPQTYTIIVKVADGRGGEAEMQLSLGVIPNSPPLIDSLAAKRARANRGEFIVIECLASDTDEDSLTYTWSATGGTFYGTGSITTWEAPLTLGTYTITVEVTDGRGGEASGRLTLDVTANHSPVIESLAAEHMVVIFGKSTNINCVASDPDGDALTYFWAAADGEISGEGSAVIWTAPDACGEYITVTVTVVDDRGGEASRELSIRVRKPG